MFHRSFKIGRYFLLKFNTLLALLQIYSSYDMYFVYYGMSAQHLIIRKEHLDFNSIQRSAVKDHILFVIFVWMFNMV